jgi:2-methylisocitrate lyase-like PEP mutase family enzyme
MKAKQKAEQFAKLHIKGKPVILYNAWDAGSAKAIVESGAKAVATSSWSVAEAQGYRDGESIPLALGLCCKTPCCAANAQLSNPNERCF